MQGATVWAGGSSHKSAGTALAIVALGSALLGCISQAAGAQDLVAEIDDVTVFVHYRARDDRPIADATAEILGAYDYRVAAKRLSASAGGGEVRYFRTEDRKAALHVQAIVENVLASKGSPARVVVASRSARRAGAKSGRIEVWVPSALGRKRTPPTAAAHGRVQDAHKRSRARRGGAPKKIRKSTSPPRVVTAAGVPTP